jgi:TolB-like 6-blade propeller-like
MISVSIARVGWVSLLLAFVVSAGCERSRPFTRSGPVVSLPSVVRSQFPRDSQVLAAYAFVRDSVGLRMVSTLSTDGAFFVAADQHTTPHFAVIDPGSGSVIARFGAHGRGAGQLVAPRLLEVSRLDSIGVFIDHPTRKIGRARITSAGGELVDETDLPPRLTPSVPAVVARHSTGWIAFGYFPDEAFFVVDTSSRRITAVIGPNVFDSAAVPIALQRGAANERSFAVAPGTRRIASAYKHAAQIELYSTDGASVIVSRPLDVSVRTAFHLRAESRGLVWDREDQYAYVALAVTESRIYALFCGCGHVEKFANEVHVFDWSGNAIKRIMLDRGVYAIAVTDDDQTLAGATWVPSEGVALWRLPSVARLSIGSDRPTHSSVNGR